MFDTILTRYKLRKCANRDASQNGPNRKRAPFQNGLNFRLKRPHIKKRRSKRPQTEMSMLYYVNDNTHVERSRSCLVFIYFMQF